MPGWLAVGRETMARFGARGGWMISSHVAMSSMMALFPFLIFLVALAGELASGVADDDLLDLIFGTWPEEIAAPIETELRAVLAQNSGQLMTWGGVFTLFFASNGVNAIRAAMVRAYRGPDPRPFWLQRLICLAFVIAGGIAVLGIAALGLAIPAYLSVIGEALPGLYTGAFMRSVAPYLVTVLLLVGGITACHMWLPPHRRPMAALWPGILLTLALGFVAAQGFAIYVSRFASYSATYAGLAGAMSSLIFLYLMSAILLLGAELNGTLETRRAGPGDGAADSPD